MIINPIIPVWLMGILCVVFLCFKRKDMASYIRQIIIVILLFIINLRIMTGDGQSESVTASADILFVVDNTISMLAEDCNGSMRRIDAVREDCKYIMERLPGAHYSVVSFDKESKVLTPYTCDALVTEYALKALNGQGSLYAVGSSMNIMLEKLPEILNNKRDNYQVVFFITDGEITNGERLKKVSGIDRHIDAGAVLGYGTKEGGPMRAQAFLGDDDEPEYLTSFDLDLGEVKSLSKIDEKNLKSIAANLGVDYVHMAKTSELDSMLKEIKQEIEMQSKVKEKESPDGYQDTYFWWIIPLLLLLIYDFIYYRRRGGLV